MDDEFFEDTVCVVNYTESQKSIATSHAYSQEFTDSSSSKESRRTYVIEVDSDAAPAAPAAATSAQPAASAPPGLVSRSVSANLHTYSLISQETFTQTSKTIFELAQINDIKDTNTTAIETQTSRVSIVENKTVEYRIHVSGSSTRFSRQEQVRGAGWEVQGAGCGAQGAGCGAQGVGDDSDRGSSVTLRTLDDAPKPTSSDRLQPFDDTSDNADTSRCDTDSLEEYNHVNRDTGDDGDRSVTKSVDRDVEDLYDKLERSFDLRSFGRPEEFDIPRPITLTPLPEETTGKAEGHLELSRKEVVYKKNNVKCELPTKTLLGAEENKEQCKLPPIRWRRAGSPARGRWDARGAGLAAGEGAGLCARTGTAASPHLPSIYFGSGVANRGDGGAARTRASCDPHGPRDQRDRRNLRAPRDPRDPHDPRDPRDPHDPLDPCDQRETISIHHNIQQLKMPPTGKKWTLYSSTTTGNMSSSPGSTDGGAGAAAMARGCEALCADVVARLRRHVSCPRPTFEPASGARAEGTDQGASWEEAVEVLEEIPARFRGFWTALPEHRIADLLRLVTAQVDSPRTRVARAACGTLAAILTHTNYTKKPDFMEAVTALLVKTGSCVRVLRHAANVALDAVVARVDPSHAITALCLFGVEHKSPAVRCAAARLLVVCAALARGGRGLLRAAPPSAAAARRQALRALSALLHDRNQETRKYAERLYALLRPLPGFEAFFLADVGARAACRQLARYDPLLAPAPT